MPAGKYETGHGPFDDNTWLIHGVLLPILGATTVSDKGPTNTGNTAPLQNPDWQDREGAPDVDPGSDPGQDDMSDDW